MPAARLRSRSRSYRYFPVPVRLTACGDPAALSATFKEAVNDPVVVGLKLTEMVQLAPTATVLPQVVVLVNDDAFAPLIVIPPELIVSGAPPVFFNVTTFAALVVPTVVLVNVIALGVNETAGGGTLPVRVTV